MTDLLLKQVIFSSSDPSGAVVIPQHLNDSLIMSLLNCDHDFNTHSTIAVSPSLIQPFHVDARKLFPLKCSFNSFTSLFALVNTINGFSLFPSGLAVKQTITLYVKRTSNPVPVTNEWKLMLSKNLTFISSAMSRCEILEWKSCYELEFSSVIRGHHVYKKSWSPYVGEKLMCKIDNRQEAK